MRTRPVAGGLRSTPSAVPRHSTGFEPSALLRLIPLAAALEVLRPGGQRCDPDAHILRVLGGPGALGGAAVDQALLV